MKRFISLLLFMGGCKVYCQDTIKISIPDITFDTVSRFIFTGSQLDFAYLSHSPVKKDYRIYKLYGGLVNQQPASKNYDRYYALACSLWELGKLPEAEKMFLNIINSKGDYYGATYCHSSDVPGEKSPTVYGYGSYTSSYKNSAAIYLAKINIERKRFSKAFQYMEVAVKKYKVNYTCGTGYMMQQYEYDCLYASCYKGMNKEIPDLLLPDCLIHDAEIFIKAIRNYLNSFTIFAS